jgi:hypothetical protein
MRKKMPTIRRKGALQAASILREPIASAAAPLRGFGEVGNTNLIPP